MKPGLRLLGFAMVLTAQNGCQSTGPSEVPLGQEFELAPNQSVVLAGTNLTVAFRRVAGDSRCPIDVLCATEGGAAVELATFGAGPEQPIEFRTPFPRAWSDNAHQIRVLALRPERTANRPIGPDEYRIVLVVDLVTR